MSSAIKMVTNKKFLQDAQQKCEDILSEIPMQDRRVLLNLVASMPEHIEQLKELCMKYKKEYTKKYNMKDPKDLVKMLRKFTGAVRKSSAYVRAAVDFMEKNLDKMEAVGKAALSYLKCVVQHVPKDYQEVAKAALELIMTTISVVAKEKKVIDFANKAIRIMKKGASGSKSGSKSGSRSSR